MARKKICLVLGGNGFIGSHIVDKLSANNDVLVKVFDQFSEKPQFNKSKNIEMIKGSVLDFKLLNKSLKGVDFVVNCLSSTNPFTADKDPYADLKGLQDSIEIFEHCVKAGIKKIVFISSGGAVYGRLAETKIATEVDPPQPVSPYGITKLAVEHYLEYFKRKYHVDYVVCRLSNPYGPRQVFKKEQGVIPAFLNKIVKGETLTIIGDGTNSRDYIYVEDAAAMISNLVLEATKNSVYNIGSGRQTSLNEILAILQDVFGDSIAVEYIKAPETFLNRTDISIDLYRSEFGEPVILPFEDSLKRMIKAGIREQKLNTGKRKFDNQIND